MPATSEDVGEQAAENLASPNVGAFFDLTSGNTLRGKMGGYWQGTVEWAENLGMAQKILLTFLVLSSAYMLVFYSGLFLALLLMLGLAFTTIWFSGRSYQRFALIIKRHQFLSGVCLLVIVCSTPVLMPAIGTLLVGVAATVVGLAVIAGVVGIGLFLGSLITKSMEEERARREAHRRWYNSLSEQQKQTYQMERQTRLMEEQRQWDHYERTQRQWDEWERKMRRKR